MGKMVLSIGSNSSDREWQMSQTIKRLRENFKVVAVSEIYETEAVNGVDAPYLNAVAVASTSMTYEDVLSFTKQWETICGRTPASKLQGVIPVDLDVVVWDGEIKRERDYEHEYFARGYKQLIDDGKITNSLR